MIRFCKLTCALVLFCQLSGAAFAQRELKEIPLPDPELERQSFQVADGFEVSLYAADPLIAKPIQMNFDAAGRLWVASSEVYPQILPGQVANDRIVVLEDRDGDGQADKTSVFADGLLIPTGVEPGDGGAYVANSTELVHFRDTDGDGRADRRQTLLSGFGTEDTHHILHTLRWGPEGLLYFNQSIYIHSHIETPHGVRRLNGGGVWHFRPETRELEVFIRGLVNTWGHHFDRWGQSFGTDGAGGEGINYFLPGAYYFTAVNATRILHGLNPGSPKHCGIEIVSGRHLPDDWQGNAITNDFRAHRVCRFVLSEDGSGYSSQQKTELIKSTNVAFRPIDVKMGPDGAIYIADWYNPIIQHGEVDFRDPRRDHTHGRIWRVTAKDRPLVPRPNLVGAPVSELLDHLRDPEEWTRRMAKRVLKERGAPAVLPELSAWLERLDRNSPDLDHHRLEALWTYQALDVVEPGLLGNLLRATDPRIRAAATRVAYHWHKRLTSPTDLLAAQVLDEHPRVRLEGVRALAQLGTPRAFALALKALDTKQDRYLDYGLWLTSRELEPKWLPALARGELDFSGREKQLAFALLAVDSPAAVEPMIKLIKENRLAESSHGPAIKLIAAHGTPDQLAFLFGLVVDDPSASEGRRVELLNALNDAARKRKLIPTGDLARVASLFNSPNESLRTAAISAAGLWKLSGVREPLVALAKGSDTPAALRQAALEGLVQIGDPECKSAIESLADAPHDGPVRLDATEALAQLDINQGARRAIALLGGQPPAASDAGPTPAPQPVANANPQRLFDFFLKRDKGPESIVAAIADNALPRDVAKLGVRAARGTGRDESALIGALEKAGGLSSAPPEPNAEEVSRLAADVLSKGDPARGEAIFRRTDQQCLKCHAIGGAGGQVGPDLSSIGASAQVDYLIESVLIPNKAVKENYHSLVINTTDGKVVTGVLLRRNDNEVALRSAEDQELTVPLASIDEEAPGASLMPVGLVDMLTREEVVDLVRFLSELGKVGPYAVEPARVARRWQVLADTPEALKLLEAGVEGAIKADSGLRWDPAYSQVSGVLPVDNLPKIKPSAKLPPTSLVRCEFDVSTGGKLKLAMPKASSLKAWIDDRPLEAESNWEFEVEPGRHWLTLSINRDARKDPIRVELIDLPDSPARAQIVAGK